MSGIFKAYDIRGVYPKELNEHIAYNIGNAFVKFLKVKKVLIGRDGRLSSPNLFKALANGITDQGANVVDIGLCSTPMFYFASASTKSKASIMVTASHNTKEYNGFKLCRDSAFPISEDTGIKEIEHIAKNYNFKPKAKKGKIIQKNILDAYITHNLKFVKTSKPYKIVVDAANGMGSYTFPKIFAKLPFVFIPLYCKMDFTFPNHEANPLKHETLLELQKKVIKENADIGIALDGDADRCVFVDEKGNIISSDFITALVGAELLSSNKNKKILYDLRSSNIVKEFIESKGGKAIMCRVGHSFIKKQMRKEKAIFAGELSGHFYYKDNYYTESSFITTALILNIMSEEQKPLSRLIMPLKKYFQSGEINFEVKDKDRKIHEIENRFKDADRIMHLDGLSIYYKHWWFNIRPSNTEPLLRLNIEADTDKLMKEKKDYLFGLLSKQ